MAFLSGGAPKDKPPPLPPPPPNPPTYASAAEGPGRGSGGPVGGLASTILTSPMGTTAPYTTSKKALLGG